jgi:cytochrome c biogenesis protein CcmG/thiol:disulfide interchange protein DsbE
VTAPVSDRRRIAPWIAGAVLVVLAAFIGVLATGGDDEGVRSTLIGRPAPGITGETIEDATYDLADHRGEFVVVNYFATWCVPCIREHPELVEFEERHRETGDASVVSVVFDSRPQQVREFFAEYGGDWPVVLDPDGRTALEYGVTGVPESYLVAPDGTVLLKIEGGVTAEALDDLLEQAQVADVEGEHLDDDEADAS